MPIKGRAEFSKDLHDRAGRFCRALALQSLSSLVRMTPRDTGRCASNWNIGINNIDRTTDVDATHANIGPNLSEGVQEIGAFKVGDVLYATNGLPYVMPLENGHSNQAPGGMVKITAAQMKKFAERAAQGIRVTGGEWRSNGL